MSRPTPSVEFVTNVSDPFLRHFLALASVFIGIHFVCSGRVPSVNSTPRIYYGRRPEDGRWAWIPAVSSYSRHNIPLPKPPYTAPEKDEFPFDIVKAIEFWLTDQAHQATRNEDLDRHRRLRFECTAFHQLGISCQPIINAYLILFRRWLECQLGVVAAGHLPPGRRCIVVLSHDVDTPLNPSDWGHSLWKMAAFAADGYWTAIPEEFMRFARRVKNRCTNGDDSRWLFEEVLGVEAGRRFQSTFFFSAIPDPRLRHGYDVVYDVRSLRFRKLFRQLRADGFEIGLHGSYHSCESVSNFRSEICRLEECSEVTILGNRQHCWKMLDNRWKTLEFMESAGLVYDSSIAFNDIPGFRLGIAFPFLPFAPQLQRALGILEIPVMLMDGAYFYREQPDPKRVAQQFTGLLAQLKQHEGVAAIDWHDDRSFPGSNQFRKWGEGYLAILAVLAADPEVAVMNCEQVCQLYRQQYVNAGGLP